jgi:hypothetical protein
MTNGYKVSVGKPERKRPLGRNRRECKVKEWRKDNNEIVCEVMDGSRVV